MVSFEEISPSAANSVLAAFIYKPANALSKADVSMCGIRATWEPIKMWVFLAANRDTVLSNFTWDGLTGKYGVSSYYHKEWLDLKNQ